MGRTGKSDLSYSTKDARRARLRRRKEAARMAEEERNLPAFTASGAAREWRHVSPTFANPNFSGDQQVICKISSVRTDVLKGMSKEDNAFTIPSWQVHDEPLVYSSQAQAQPQPQRKRNDSIEEVVPDDPFADIKPEELMIEPSVEFEIKKEEQYFEDEDNGCEDATAFDNFEYEALESNAYSLRTEGAGHEESPETQTEQETPDHLYLEDFRNVTYREVNDIDYNNLTGQPIELTYMCPIKYCSNAFINERRLRIHMSREHNWYSGTFKYNCSQCFMSYDRKNSLAVHMKRKHGPQSIKEDKTELTCDICFNILIGQRRMRFHMQRRHQVTTDAFIYKCKKCPFTYDRASSLLMHVRRKHGRESNKQYHFACPRCPKFFTNRQSYVAHLKRKHKKEAPTLEKEGKESDVDCKQFRCQECSMLFTGIDRLKLHMRRKHNALRGLFRYRCPHCRLSYEKRQSMQRHMQRKHNRELYCITCKIQFSTQKEYDNHTHNSTKVSKAGIHQCAMCKMIYIRLGSLRNHMRLCHGTRSESGETTSFYCEKCGEGYESKHHLDTHTRNAHTDASYKCNICDKSFHLKGSLGTHIFRKHRGAQTESKDAVEKEDCAESSGNNEQESVTPKDEIDRDDYDDSFCTEPDQLEFNDEVESKDADVKKEEDEKQVLKCTECEEVFDSWLKVRNHLKKVHIQKDSSGEAVPCKDVICQHCGLVCTETQLNKHMRAEHKDKFNIYKCDQCNYTTFKRDLLIKHESNHNLEKNCVCTHDGCAYKTHNKYHLQKHIAIHTGKSKLKCPLCPYESNDSNLMRNHKYEHDTGKKRYQCDKCDYATNIPASIVHHRFKHSDERNFKCNLCKFSSKYSTSLWLHKKQKHSDKSPLNLKCDITKRPDAETGTVVAEDSVEDEKPDIKIKEDQPVVEST